MINGWFENAVGATRVPNVVERVNRRKERKGLLSYRIVSDRIVPRAG
jgi:hypothetical protein